MALTKRSRSRLVAFIAVLAITAMGLITVAGIVLAGHTSIKQSLSNFEQSNSVKAVLINDWFERNKGYVEAVANDFSFFILFAGYDEARKLLQTHSMLTNQWFFQFAAGFPDGTLIVSDNTHNADETAFEQAWYYGALSNAANGYISLPWTDPRSGKTAVTFSAVIEREGKTLGVLAGNIFVEQLQMMAGETNTIESAGYSFIASESGAVIAHPAGNDSFLFEALAPEAAQRVEYSVINLLKFAKEDKAFLSRISPHESFYSVHHKIPRMNWRLYSIANKKTIEQDVSNRVILAVALFLLLLTLVLVLLYITTRTLRKATKSAQTHSRMKSTFLANMSHELRTPMNGIIGFTELALNTKNVPENLKEYLIKIQICTKGLTAIVDDILDISKIESGKITLEYIPFSIRELFTYCETATAISAANKGIGLCLSVDSKLNNPLLGDPTKLRQILLNLLSNAVKFTNSGTVKLLVNVTKEANNFVWARFEAEDSGIGMSEEQVQRIFEPFEQADMAITRKYGGTGLGLSITKRLVELMGGELHVESALGAGSKFDFTLKFEIAGGEVKEKSAARPVETEKSDGPPVFAAAALVCEDNEINQEVIIEQLQNAGIQAVIAPNGKIGVEKAMSAAKDGKPFDIIFMDIFMPVMNGLEAAQELRNLGFQTPIIALTANVLTDDTDQYKKSGIDGSLNKPFTAHELWDCLAKYLGKR